MFVLKSGAGFSIFKWIAYLASDFLAQALQGAVFFFDQDTVDKHWFFVNTLASIIFFIAFVQMMYYLGVMQWLIRGLYVYALSSRPSVLTLAPLVQRLVLLQDHERLRC